MVLINRDNQWQDRALHKPESRHHRVRRRAPKRAKTPDVFATICLGQTSLKKTSASLAKADWGLWTKHRLPDDL